MQDVKLAEANAFMKLFYRIKKAAYIKNVDIKNRQKCLKNTGRGYLAD